jgi:hypothetical protein
VLTAGVSSLVTGLSGANGVTAGTILSGTSAMMPELSNVVEAKDRAEAYADGMKSIGVALSVYRSTIAEKHDGTVSGAHLTPAGATLYGTMRSAVGVVETRLAGLLPSTKELAQARSVQGGPVRGSSGNNQVATVKEVADSSGTKFDVAATSVNCHWTTITLSNGRGGKDSVVTRIETDPAFDLASTTLQVSKAAASTTQLPAVVRGCPIKAVRSNNPDIVRIERPSP